MPEMIDDKTVFSLTEVLISIQKTLATRYTNAFWVKAEMNKLNYYKHSGHCYPELVDKSDGKVVSEIRAILWNSDYNRINQKFLTILQEPLKDGIKILFSARIQFDPKYGLSLQILDIDPSFTLGDLQREKQETIQRLVSENIYNKNKLLKFPLLPKRIAVISVETSKGYADFLSVIGSNQWGYQFFQMLFPSLLQGDRAAASIIAQLRRIRTVKSHFDVVAIIRGGGGDIGLTCYNNYELSKFICNFPIPVLTGIGHATNETVVEMIAHTNAITPTKLAEFLIQHFHNFNMPVQDAQQKIVSASNQMIKEAEAAFYATTRLFRSVTSGAVMDRKHEIAHLTRSLGQYSKKVISEEQQEIHTLHQRMSTGTGFALRNFRTELDAAEKNIKLLHPINVLKRGYSITRLNGKVVTEVAAVKKGDKLTTELADGKINSIVSTTQKTTKENE